MNRWNRLLRRGRMEAQLEKELRFHVDQHTADLVAHGHHPEEARRLARLAFGGPEQIKEECRDARGTRWLEDFWQDVRYAVRTLGKNPGFALAALCTLALGCGATTVMFTVVNGVLLKPLPYPEPGRLMKVDEQTKGVTDYRWGDRWAFAYPNFQDCEREIRSLDLAAFRYSGGTVSGSGDPEYVDGFEISQRLLPILGARFQLGRGFDPEEDRPGAAPVAIISHALWQRRFGGSPATLAMPFNLEGKPHTIIGILSPDFRFRDADVLTPIGQNALPFMRSREVHPGIQVWGRLRSAATPAEAQAELSVVGRQLAAEFPNSNQGRTFIAEPLRPEVGGVRSTLWLLLGAVSLVLLIACANVASLLLARAVSRERELAMRAALGASRGRLARQCLTESAVLGLFGGALGTLLAIFGVKPFVAMWPGSLPRAQEVQLDWRVLLFAVTISIAGGLLFGLAPALRIPTRKLDRALRSGGRTVAGSSRRLHSSFVAGQIAIAVVLLTSAGMLGRTLLHLASLDPGINIDNLLTARVGISPGTLENPPRIRAAWQDVLDRARGVLGVQSAALVDTVPMREGDNELGYWSAPPEPPRSRKPLAQANSVTPDYLKVAGVRLLRGRFFNEHDRMGSEPVAVIDEVLARHAFGGRNPLGKRLWTDLVPNPLTIVGVVGHVRYWGLAGDDQAEVRDQFYYPFAQVPDSYLRRWSELMSIAVRTGVPPLNVVGPLRRQVRGATGDQVLYEVRTMKQLASQSLGRQRFLLVLFGVFAALALALAGIGIYGVLAYLTSRRVPEIGLRMALGATGPDVMRLVLRESFGIVLAGLAIGVAGAMAAGRVLGHVVEGMQPGALPAFAVAVPVLAIAALCASLVPARRAGRVDPMRVLRQE